MLGPSQPVNFCSPVSCAKYKMRHSWVEAYVFDADTHHGLGPACRCLEPQRGLCNAMICGSLRVYVQVQEGSGRGRAILAAGSSSWRKLTRRRLARCRQLKMAGGLSRQPGGRALPGGGTAPQGAAGSSLLRAHSTTRRRSLVVERTPLRCVSSAAAIAVDLPPALTCACPVHVDHQHTDMYSPHGQPDPRAAPTHFCRQLSSVPGTLQVYYREWEQCFSLWLLAKIW